MRSMGYLCYFEVIGIINILLKPETLNPNPNPKPLTFKGNPHLTRLTGCWDSSLEIRRWSNVVCVLHKHPLAPILDGASFLHTDPALRQLLHTAALAKLPLAVHAK
jgi:hypothetical protein